MKMLTESAPAGEPGESLEQVQERFARWRAGRQRGARIPGALWAQALAMAERHGVQRAAQVLRLDRGRLERRLQRAAAPAPAPAGPVAAQFMELFVPPVSAAASPCTCLVDMDNARGGKMRVELNNVAALASLADAFWRAQ